MASKGFILLHRSIQDHWIYEEKRKFSRYEAWLDLLMMVNHKDARVLQDGELVEVKRGERITSIRQLMERWDWSNTKVVNFLELLKKDGMINFQVTPKKKTQIKIVQYEKYQGFREDDQSQKQTEKRHETDSQTTQNNINNNDNNENKYIDDDNKQTQISKINAFQFYEQNGFGTLSSYIGQRIGFWIDDLENEELIIEAMKRALERNARNWAYVETILIDWSNKGFKSISEVETEQLRYEAQKQNKGGRNNRGGNQQSNNQQQSGWGIPKDSEERKARQLAAQQGIQMPEV